MHLVEIDDVGAQPPQRVLDLPADAGGTRIAKHRAALPLESHFGRDLHLVTQSTLRERLPDDLLGAAETVDGSGVDECR